MSYIHKISRLFDYVFLQDKNTRGTLQLGVMLRKLFLTWYLEPHPRSGYAGVRAGLLKYPSIIIIGKDNKACNLKILISSHVFLRQGEKIEVDVRIIKTEINQKTNTLKSSWKTEKL